jgi:hypothetical protein
MRFIILLLITTPAFAGQGNDRTPPGLTQVCAEYDDLSGATGQDELGDALADEVLTNLAPIGIAPDAPVLALATPRGTIAVAQHGYGAETAFVTEVSGETVKFGDETIALNDATIVSLQIASNKAGFATTATFYNADGEAVAEARQYKTGPWLSLDGISFTGSTARIEDTGGRAQITATAKYGDILIDGVPLEFD